nr:glycoprotein-N-acetylgalactosamine 3-beta-galactosyltransferase 1-like [Cherax quadricarinatus]
MYRKLRLLVVPSSILVCVFLLVINLALLPTTPPRPRQPREEDEKEVEAHKMVGRKNRILCWIPTSAENHYKRARHVKNTWARHCHLHIFFSNIKDTELDSVKLEVSDGYENLWGKTKAALVYLHKHHLHHADWFLKADDDTFVIVENLQNMLKLYDPNFPIFFGNKLKKPNISQGFMSGEKKGELTATRKVVILRQQVITGKNESTMKSGQVRKISRVVNAIMKGVSAVVMERPNQKVETDVWRVWQKID